MTTNLPADFPPNAFALIAFCETCGHQAILERDRLAPGATVQGLPTRLRYSQCQFRPCTMRIVYIGAGGFHHGGGTFPGT